MPDAVSEPPATSACERSTLAADVLRTCGRLRLQVRGESMLPILWPRDVVEITACSIEEAKPGDIVLALRGGRFFLHRLLARCRPSGFLLQGDSMPAPDPQFPDEALIGRLLGREGRWADPRVVHPRFAGQRYFEQYSTRQQFASSSSALPLRPWSWAVGRLLCYCEPAHRLALRMHAVREQRHALQKLEGACRNAGIDLGVS
jgi:hypothetical protein